MQLLLHKKIKPLKCFVRNSSGVFIFSSSNVIKKTEEQNFVLFWCYNTCFLQPLKPFSGGKKKCRNFYSDPCLIAPEGKKRKQLQLHTCNVKAYYLWQN